jgi:hypothetical protein
MSELGVQADVKRLSTLSNLNRSSSNFAIREEKLKQDYYKSNPLKSYASGKGERYLPRSSKPNVNSIYWQLRITQDIKKNPQEHRKKLKTTLNLNYECKVQSLERSVNSIARCRRLYKPVDLSSVESLIKQSLLPRAQLKFISSLSSSSSSSTSASSSTLLSASGSTGIFVNAKSIQIMSLEELNGCRNRNRFVKPNSSRNQHKGTIHNYRNLKRTLCKIEKSKSDASKQIATASNRDNRAFPTAIISIHEKQPSLRGEHFGLANRKEFILEPCKNDLLNENEMQISNAFLLTKRSGGGGDKPVHPVNVASVTTKSERAHLNKITVLQPFEETKIFINVDQASSPLLNKLLNTNSTKFHMPSANASAYFKVFKENSKRVANTSCGKKANQTKEKKII